MQEGRWTSDYTNNDHKLIHAPAVFDHPTHSSLDTNEYPTLNLARRLLTSKRYESTWREEREETSGWLAERDERLRQAVVWSGHGAVKGPNG
jgi:hypothetical protein